MDFLFLSLYLLTFGLCGLTAGYTILGTCFLVAALAALILAWAVS